MIRTFARPLGLLIEACSGFGSYNSRLQSDCLRRKSNGQCEGSPTADEAKQDYLRTVENSIRGFLR